MAIGCNHDRHPPPAPPMTTITIPDWRFIDVSRLELETIVQWVAFKTRTTPEDAERSLKRFNKGLPLHIRTAASMYVDKVKSGSEMEIQ